MTTASDEPSAQSLAAHMDEQRAQLQAQFVREPEPAAESQADQGMALASPSLSIEPWQPRSMLMKLLVANPQLLQRVLLLAATTAMGARLSPWALSLLKLLLPSRRD